MDGTACPPCLTDVLRLQPSLRFPLNIHKSPRTRTRRMVPTHTSRHHLRLLLTLISLANSPPVRFRSPAIPSLRGTLSPLYPAITTREASRCTPKRQTIPAEQDMIPR